MYSLPVNAFMAGLAGWANTGNQAAGKRQLPLTAAAVEAPPLSLVLIACPVTHSTPAGLTPGAVVWGAIFLLIVIIVVAVIVTFVDPHEDREAHGLAPLAALLEGLVGVGRGPPAQHRALPCTVRGWYRLSGSQIPLHRWRPPP